MLSVFPELLPYGLLAPTIIRIVVGLVIFTFGIIILFIRKKLVIQRLQEIRYPLANFVPWPLGILELVTGGFLIIGFMTQVMAIVVSFLFFKMMLLDSKKEKILHQGTIFYLAMITISLSLLFSGAGIFAVDLPL